MTQEQRDLLQWIDKRQRDLEEGLAALARASRSGDISPDHYYSQRRYYRGKLKAYDEMERHILGFMS